MCWAELSSPLLLTKLNTYNKYFSASTAFSVTILPPTPLLWHAHYQLQIEYLIDTFCPNLFSMLCNIFPKYFKILINIFFRVEL